MQFSSSFLFVRRYSVVLCIFRNFSYFVLQAPKLQPPKFRTRLKRSAEVLATQLLVSTFLSSVKILAMNLSWTWLNATTENVQYDVV